MEIHDPRQSRRPRARAKKCSPLAGFLLALAPASGLAGPSRPCPDQPTIVIRSDHFRYTVSPAGANLGFVDLDSGEDHLRRDPPSACATITQGGRSQPVTAAALLGDLLTLRFGDGGARATVRVEGRSSHVKLTVESVEGDGIDSLVFLEVPLDLKARPEEPFGACALSLNLHTRVDQLPALQTALRASCHRKFGLAGASVAIVAAPRDRILPALREVLAAADEMPHSKVAGPWADEVAFNHGSYLFNFGDLTESTVGEWIERARSLGVTQIDNHGGRGFFRFGDFELDRTKWPGGWETFRRIVDRLHEAGIGSIFHTYAFFIDKQSRYVTPVPDPRLDAFRTFTLADPLDATATEVTVAESTAGLGTVTGFFEHNSVVLHIGDELVTFSGVRQEPPFGFTGLGRGALGTTASAHAIAARARHLKECFGLLVPDPESTLLDEIARNHAEIVNRCGFDGIYLDAIDGSSILRGAEECWYWADRFVFKIQERLERPVGMEMSAMWHHFWQFRTRWQAWDYPRRGHRRFIDLHAASINGPLLLPLHLGWWNFQTFDPPQVEPTYPDVMEYLGAKMVGWNAGISLTGSIDRARLRDVPLFRRAVDTLRICEELRRGGAIDEKGRAELRTPGEEFTLSQDSNGGWTFRRVHRVAHTVSTAEPWTLSWTAVNPFADQPLRFRLEALMSAGSHDDPDTVLLLDLSSPGTAQDSVRGAPGVTVEVIRDPGSPQEAAAGPGVELRASNAGEVARRSAWARLDRRFDPVIDLKGHRALGLRVEGDGGGELLGIRLESPRHLAFGAVADRYIDVDFTGRRVLTLVETESSRWSDYQWDDGKWLYNVYRETIRFDAVESITLWYQNLPVGGEVRCRIGPIRALPLVPCTVRRPALTLDGEMLVLPVELSSGGYIEFDGTEATVHGARGEKLSTVRPLGAVPIFGKGSHRVTFSCAATGGPPSRVKVTLVAHGNRL